MRRTTFGRSTLAFGLAAAICVGCGSGDDGTKGGGKGQLPPVKGTEPGPGTNVESPPEAPKPVEPPPPPTIPKVLMEDALRSTFLVWLDEGLPEADLPDLQGKPHPIRSLLGKKLTIVVFWDSKRLSGLQELQDLAEGPAAAQADQGIAVVSIAVGETPETARRALPEAAAKLPVLLDADGAYFAKVAKPSDKTAIDLLPRTYALDAAGKVLWLDAGYSEATSRGISRTTQVVLSEKDKP